MDLSFPRRRWLPALVALTLGGGCIGLAVRLTQARRRPPPQAIAPIRTVTALGRLEPVGEVRTIAAPSAGSGQPTLRSLLVEEGDRVRRGQVLAVLDSEPRLRAAVAEARAQSDQARARLTVVQADSRSGLGSQAARVASLRAQLRTAGAELERYQSLFERGAVSAQDRDDRRLTRETVAASLQEAQVQLARQRAGLAAGETVDVIAARRGLEAALAALASAQARHGDSLVRSPIDGRVLGVRSRAGEAAGTDGIVEVGQTDRMQVVAEVYESDRGRVRPGQPVRITSPALPGPLDARVGRIGAIVRRQAVINTDPSANTDSRVVEVHAPLTPASSARAAGFSNLQVRAVIGP